nr:unnamed protein product [Callosobruchus chinensis]
MCDNSRIILYLAPKPSTFAYGNMKRGFVLKTPLSSLSSSSYTQRCSLKLIDTIKKIEIPPTYAPDTSDTIKELCNLEHQENVADVHILQTFQWARWDNKIKGR